MTYPLVNIRYVTLTVSTASESCCRLTFVLLAAAVHSDYVFLRVKNTLTTNTLIYLLTYLHSLYLLYKKNATINYNSHVS